MRKRSITIKGWVVVYALLTIAFLCSNWTHAQVTTNSAATGVPQSPTSVAITGGSIDGTTVGVTTRASGFFTAIASLTYKDTNNHLLVSSTAPTYASGGCTGAAIVTSNNTAAFSASVGSSACSGSQPLVFTLPAAATSWNCRARDITQPTFIVLQTGAQSTTSVTITNYGTTPGTAVAWVASDVVEISCMAY